MDIEAAQRTIWIGFLFGLFQFPPRPIVFVEISNRQWLEVSHQRSNDYTNVKKLRRSLFINLSKLMAVIDFVLVPKISISAIVNDDSQNVGCIFCLKLRISIEYECLAFLFHHVTCPEFVWDIRTSPRIT